MGGAGERLFLFAPALFGGCHGMDSWGLHRVASLLASPQDDDGRDGSANPRGLGFATEALDSQELADIGAVEILGRAGVDDLAAVHDVDLVRQFPAEI